MPLPDDTRCSCCSRRRSQSATRCCCGGPPLASGSLPGRLRGRRPALLDIGERVTFRHPLVRSALYRSAAMEDRRAVHALLAEATDATPILTVGLGIWRAAAAGPDEQSPPSSSGRPAGPRRAGVGCGSRVPPARDRADPRPGAAAAGRSPPLTPASRPAPSSAARTAGGGEAGSPDELQRARVDLLRAEIAFASRRGSDAPPLFFAAASGSNDRPRLARDAYLDAFFGCAHPGR